MSSSSSLSMSNMGKMGILNILYDDLYRLIFSFLLYTESVKIVQMCKLFKLKHSIIIKFCKHIQPHGYTKIGNVYSLYLEGKLKIKKEWYENTEILKSEENFNYKQGIKELHKQGIQKYWHPNGKLFKKLNYYMNNNPLLLGKQDGIQKEWYNNGRKLSEYIFKNGKLNGTYIIWNENGTTKTIDNYNDGLKKPLIFYNGNKRL